MLKISKSLHFQNSDEKKRSWATIYRNTPEHTICVKTETDFFIYLKALFTCITDVNLQ